MASEARVKSVYWRVIWDLVGWTTHVRASHFFHRDERVLTKEVTKLIEIDKIIRPKQVSKIISGQNKMKIFIVWKLHLIRNFSPFRCTYYSGTRCYWVNEYLEWRWIYFHIVCGFCEVRFDSFGGARMQLSSPHHTDPPLHPILTHLNSVHTLFFEDTFVLFFHLRLDLPYYNFPSHIPIKISH
jgi:hypothetical protein